MSEGGVSFGRYRLIEPITKGGMAEVWRAKLVGAEQFERPMVIKRILPHLCDDRDFVRMFIREARLSARLHHPNIVQVFELGDVGGELFMALEYIAGVDLLTLITAAEGPLPPGLCALVAHEVARALAYAHAVTDEQGKPLAIVHRDVSPSNIMLGYDGQVRLCDFGIAKAMGTAVDRSRTGNLKGKLSYMAPEVFDGAPFDERCDLWAVGVVMHELLTGRRLFRSESEAETMGLVRAGAVPLPSLSNRDTPPALERIVMRALARDPAARYAHAEELAAELRPVVHALRWGAPEVTALLAELAPMPVVAEPSATLSARRRSPTEERTTPQPRRHQTTWRVRARQPWVLALGGAMALAATGVGLVVALRSGPTAPAMTKAAATTAAATTASAPGPTIHAAATTSAPAATTDSTATAASRATPAMSAAAAPAHAAAPPSLPVEGPPQSAALPASRSESLPASRWESRPSSQSAAAARSPAAGNLGTRASKKHKHKRTLDIEHGDLMDKL
jgi:serine/threonine-protein kinase